MRHWSYRKLSITTIITFFFSLSSGNTFSLNTLFDISGLSLPALALGSSQAR